MESNPNHPPARGRARGRSRGPTPESVVPAADPAESTHSQDEPAVSSTVRQAIFQRGNGSSIPEEGSGSGSDRGRGDGTTGVPRGGAHSPGDKSEKDGRMDRDYVKTRDETFNKKGTDGRPLSLISNYYALSFNPKFQMSLYAVKVTPTPDEEKKVRLLVRAKAAEIGSYMLTGFQLFVSIPIKDELLNYHTVLEVKDGDGNIISSDNYEVTFDFKRVVGVGETLVLQFYNSLIRQIQSGLQYELLGRHYFDYKKKQEFASWRLELWPGFQNSIRQQEERPMLNVESVWKVVKTDSVLSIMTEIRGREGDGPNFERQCRQQIVGLAVITKYNRKPYKIDDIAFDKNPCSTFSRTKRVSLPGEPYKTETSDVTFGQYYEERYKQRIQNRQQPLLISKPTKRDIRRGHDENDMIILIPELCFPCGLSDELRSNFRLMKDLARCLHMEPAVRVRTMNDFIQSINRHEEVSKLLKKWGIKIDGEPVQVVGRAIEAQEIVLGSNRKIKGDEKADFEKGLRGAEMFSSVPLAKWAIIVTSRDSNSVGNLVNTMKRVAAPMRYRMSEPAIIRIGTNRNDAYIGGINDAMAQFQGQLDMIFVVLSNNNLETYSLVKKRCSKDFGIPSQCFLQKNFNNKGLMSICTKMVIQMIAKQGGQPWSVINPMKTVMVLGYDVHHAGAGGGSSVGAMTATMTATLGRYYSVIDKLPVGGQEIANTVAKMFEKCLIAYAKRNDGRYPGRIMMYRDGVGEGQLLDIKETEVTGFQEKINSMYKAAGQDVAKFTYIVVSKRINTRFFRKGRDYENPMPGTVVDDVVTRPERYDFFLVSQTARQGCVSPTHYNVIHDDSGLPPDKLQAFTYRLCHLYYNWSGTVSVPGPCQNAHKYAFQAGTALKGPVHMNLEYLLHYL